MISDDCLLTFTLNKWWRKFMQRTDYYEWWYICVQHSTGCSHQFINSLTSKPIVKQFLHRICMGMFEVLYLLHSSSYWRAFYHINSGIWWDSQWCETFVFRRLYWMLLKNCYSKVKVTNCSTEHIIECILLINKILNLIMKCKSFE